MYKVGIIGSGNVASHLAVAFSKAGVHVKQISSRNQETGEALATQINAKYLPHNQDFDAELDIIFVMVKDEAINAIFHQLTHFKGVLAHTSGAVEMLDRSGSSGVFYPLQTFSKNADLQISNIPFCIEGNDETSRKALHTLANKLSTNVQFVTSAQRSEIHLAAVFACNFTNHMWRISADILEKSDLELSILQPLISETFKKALTKGPKISQTGPAARNDKKILRKQLLRLDPYPFWKKIYLRVSKSIINDTNE